MITKLTSFYEGGSCIVRSVCPWSKMMNIFDFIHEARESKYEFNHSQFKIRIRLYTEWPAILEKANLEAEFYGNWEGEKYDPGRSKRLIIVAKN